MWTHSIMYRLLYKKEVPMNAVNCSDLRRNLKSYMDTVYERREALIVTRKNNENVVLASIDRYNCRVETSYLLGTGANAHYLVEPRQQARSGQDHAHELIDE